MKKQLKSLLCGLLAVALTACHSGIVEKPVTEAQEVPVNVPSAVEQALDEMDYPYIDESEYCLSLVQEYEKTGEWPAMFGAEAEAGAYGFDWDSAIAFLEGQPQKTFFVDSISHMMWQHYAEQAGDSDTIAYDTLEWIEPPDATCMTAQQAANCAGRLASSFSPESDEEIHLICLKAKYELEGTKRYYWLARIGEAEIELAPAKWQLCIDAVTGELYSYMNFSEANNPQHTFYPQEVAAEMVQEEEVKVAFQQILDAMGNGLQCGNIRRDVHYMPDERQFYDYFASVGEKVYQISYYLDSRKIENVYRHYPTELLNQTAFTAPLAGELVIAQEFTHNHNGVDYAAPKGTPVYAAIDGLVTNVHTGHSSYGNYVQITSDDRSFRTIYAHLTDINVEMGQTVTAGQIIGTVGDTGDTPGDCLYFEVRSCAERIDPAIIDFVKR